VPLVDGRGPLLVAVGLARRREQDQRRRVGGLQREGQVEEDERVRVPLQAEPDRVQDDPDNDDDRLADDVLRRPEKPRRILGVLAEGVLSEGAVVGVRGVLRVRKPRVKPVADGKNAGSAASLQV
jgi:hypothetical protein